MNVFIIIIIINLLQLSLILGASNAMSFIQESQKFIEQPQLQRTMQYIVKENLSIKQRKALICLTMPQLKSELQEIDQKELQIMLTQIYSEIQNRQPTAQSLEQLLEKKKLSTTQKKTPSYIKSIQMQNQAVQQQKNQLYQQVTSNKTNNNGQFQQIKTTREQKDIQNVFQEEVALIDTMKTNIEANYEQDPNQILNIYSDFKNLSQNELRAKLIKILPDQAEYLKELGYDELLIILQDIDQGQKESVSHSQPNKDDQDQAIAENDIQQKEDKHQHYDQIQFQNKNEPMQIQEEVLLNKISIQKQVQDGEYPYVIQKKSNQNYKSNPTGLNQHIIQNDSSFHKRDLMDIQVNQINQLAYNQNHPWKPNMSEHIDKITQPKMEVKCYTEPQSKTKSFTNNGQSVETPLLKFIQREPKQQKAPSQSGKLKEVIEIESSQQENIPQVIKSAKDQQSNIIPIKSPKKLQFVQPPAQSKPKLGRPRLSEVRISKKQLKREKQQKKIEYQKERQKQRDKLKLKNQNTKNQNPYKPVLRSQNPTQNPYIPPNLQLVIVSKTNSSQPLNAYKPGMGLFKNWNKPRTQTQISCKKPIQRQKLQKCQDSNNSNNSHYYSQKTNRHVESGYQKIKPYQNKLNSKINKKLQVTPPQFSLQDIQPQFSEGSIDQKQSYRNNQNFQQKLKQIQTTIFTNPKDKFSKFQTEEPNNLSTSDQRIKINSIKNNPQIKSSQISVSEIKQILLKQLPHMKTTIMSIDDRNLRKLYEEVHVPLLKQNKIDKIDKNTKINASVQTLSKENVAVKRLISESQRQDKTYFKENYQIQKSVISQRSTKSSTKYSLDAVNLDYVKKMMTQKMPQLTDSINKMSPQQFKNMYSKSLNQLNGQVTPAKTGSIMNGKQNSCQDYQTRSTSLCSKKKQKRKSRVIIIIQKSLQNSQDSQNQVQVYDSKQTKSVRQQNRDKQKSDCKCVCCLKRIAQKQKTKAFIQKIKKDIPPYLQDEEQEEDEKLK